MNYCTHKNIADSISMLPDAKIAGIYFKLPIGKEDVEGGLRLKGKYKRDREDKPLITYITVVYNGMTTLPRCAQSIWEQDYDNIEYIIIDGGSTDGTVTWLQQNEENIDYFISQKDRGIFDAMNKAISVANGRYLCFMNADDCCKEGAARKVADICMKEAPGIIMGRRELRNVKGVIVQEDSLPRYQIQNEVILALPLHHQSAYAHRRMFEELGYYDVTYKYIADYKWEISGIKEIFFTEDKLSVFSLGGLTGTTEPIKRWSEWSRLLQETFPELSYKQAEILHYAIRHFWKNCDFATLLREVKKQLRNDEFSKVLYETFWYTCYIEVFYLKKLINSKGIQEMTVKGIHEVFTQQDEVHSLDDLIRYIDAVLMESIKQADKRITGKQFEPVIKLKRALNKAYYHVETCNLDESEMVRRRKQRRKAVWASKSGSLTMKMAKKRFQKK